MLPLATILSVHRWCLRSARCHRSALISTFYLPASAPHRPESSTPRSYMPDTAAAPSQPAVPPATAISAAPSTARNTPARFPGPGQTRHNMNHRTVRQRHAGWLSGYRRNIVSGYAHLDTSRRSVSAGDNCTASALQPAPLATRRLTRRQNRCRSPRSAIRATCPVSPDGCVRFICLSVYLTLTSCSGIWQQLSVAAVNRCVVRNAGAKAANQHVAGLRTGCADTVKLVVSRLSRQRLSPCRHQSSSR